MLSLFFANSARILSLENSSYESTKNIDSYSDFEKAYSVADDEENERCQHSVFTASHERNKSVDENTDSDE